MPNPSQPKQPPRQSGAGTQRAPKKLPPPPQGNRRAVTHGAHAEVLPARLSAKAQAIAAELAVEAPVRGPDGGLPVYDREAVRQLARCLVRLDDVGAYLDQHGVLDRRGKERSAARAERRLRGEAARWLAALGMTPTARARLGLDLARAADLATAMSEPDPVRRAAMLRQAGVDVEGGGHLE